MNKSIFLDTAGIIALFLEQDDAHEAAVEIFEKFVQGGSKIVTTNFVLNEAVTWLRYNKVSITDVFQCLHNLYINDLEVVELGRERFSDALVLMHKYADHCFSMVDASCFIVMKELKIMDALTKDKNFVIAGFNKLL